MRNEQTNSLTTVINVLARRWPCGFSSRDVAIYAGRAEEDAIDFNAALEMASGKSLKTISATTVAVTEGPYSYFNGLDRISHGMASQLPRHHRCYCLTRGLHIQLCVERLGDFERRRESEQFGDALPLLVGR